MLSGEVIIDVMKFAQRSKPFCQIKKIFPIARALNPRFFPVTTQNEGNFGYLYLYLYKREKPIISDVSLILSLFCLINFLHANERQ